MQLEFFGAAGEVTGSCHIVRVGRATLLLDCGLIQGGERPDLRNRADFPFDASTIDAVVLSHAHIDHCGRLPLLYRRGFRGPIHATRPCRDLTRILLKDSAHMAARDAERENRRRAASGDREPIESLFPLEDVERTLQLFSGDVGQYDSPILRDPQSDQEKVVDLALMESTYGDRRHRDRADTLRELGDILAAAKRNAGNVLIPAFAVARAARPRSCRNSGSAVRRRSRWRSTASRTARSSSRAAACARAGASCTI